jgi:hypothetical protein
MEDFLKFKKMLTPIIIQIIFWIGVVGSIIFGLITMVQGAASSFGGGAMVFSGLIMIFFGPILTRIYCELLIVIFSINDSLTEIKNQLKNSSNH